MGMFSWDCNACGFSLRECRNCSEGNWMSKGVCLTPDGSRVIGHYNAYGQLGEYNLVDQIGKLIKHRQALADVAFRPVRMIKRIGRAERRFDIRVGM
jgi:hypothetical protein